MVNGGVGESRMTVNELLHEVLKPGKVEMPVLTSNDVRYLVVEKADLIKALRSMPRGAAAPWDIMRREGGILTLDHSG